MAVPGGAGQGCRSLVKKIQILIGKLKHVFCCLYFEKSYIYPSKNVDFIILNYVTSAFKTFPITLKWGFINNHLEWFVFMNKIISLLQIF